MKINKIWMVCGLIWKKLKQSFGSFQESFLEILTSQSSQRRRKRFTNMKCTEEDNETRCCRYPLMVDFEKFGWNWIIAPKKYEANYCSGECAINFLPGYTHTHVMQLATLAPACCSPRKMLPLSLLYYNRQEIVVHTTLQNMIVDMCSCSWKMMQIDLIIASQNRM